MLAAVCHRFGGPEGLRIEEIPKPVPAEREVLIHIHATTVTSADLRVRSMELPRGFGLFGRLAFGIRGPRNPILGMEFAGTVTALGPGATRYQVGDAVFGFSDTAMGCHAEYRAFPENGALAGKPDNLSFEEAAALSFGGTTALSFLREARLQPGERLLVNGASGNVGSALVQLAKDAGALVTAVCSGRNAEFVRSLGADAIVDYTREDFTTSGRTFDVIADTVGTAPFARSCAALRPGGRLLLVLADLPALLKAPWQSLASGFKVIAGPAKVQIEDIPRLAELAAAGRFRAVIDRTFPFHEIPEAHRFAETGRKRGSVVVTVP